MAELKKATTYQEQLEIIRSRGVLIDNEEFCIQKLAEINYYRLAAYFLPFKEKDDSYSKGTSFQTVYHIYEFDRKLRGILFSAVEEVEVFLRAKLAYYHAHKYGPEGYLDPANFSTKHQADKFSDNINREVGNNSSVLFVKHHLENYDGHFPIWVITELFTFGMLSKFYDDMTMPDKKKIAKDLYNTTPKNMTSWLRCATDLRNICAHYGRLYYRIFSASPAGFKIPEGIKRRLWGTVLALKSLYPDSEKWNSEVVPSIKALFEMYHGDINLFRIAFPQDWDQQILK